MALRSMFGVLAFAALASAACGEAQSPGQVQTTALESGTQAEPPGSTMVGQEGSSIEDDRVLDRPLLAVHEVCYGECYWVQSWPRYALYADGTLVRTGYRGVSSTDVPTDFFMESTSLGQPELAEVIELATVAELDSGVTVPVGVRLADDGIGTVFVSGLGVNTTVVHAPHLDFPDPSPDDQRRALRDLVNRFGQLGESAEWIAASPRWAVRARQREGDLGSVPWPGPPLTGADGDGCLLLGFLEEGTETAQLVESADATFTPSVADSGAQWFVTPRPLMPHERGCEDVDRADAWFLETYRSIDLS